MENKIGRKLIFLGLFGLANLCHGHTVRDLPELPVSAFAKHNRKIAQLVVLDKNLPDFGRPLYDYNGNSPTSNRLTTNMERVSKIGQPLAMKCSSEKTMKSCKWTTPNKTTFDSKSPIEGVTAILNDDHNCHIQINSLSKEQLGKWSCRVELEGENQYQEAILTATESLPVTEGIRLPSHVLPESYVIHLTPFIIPENYTIEGHVDIVVNVNENADNIVLHIKDIVIYENLVSVRDEKSGEKIQIKGHAYDKEREFYIIKVNVQAGHSYKVSVGFSAKLNNDLAGFYRSTYYDSEKNVTKVIGTSQMEATDARRAVPCFDEPAMKATFQINLGRLKSMTSISNMPIEKEGVEMPDTSEYVWDIYKDSLKMSTYLLAFIVSDFKYRDGFDTGNGVKFRIWSRNEALASTKYAADIGPKVLSFYEKYFNVKFPLPKQDMIALPDFSAGAMENWGAITYREVALLHDPEVDSDSRRVYVATVVAHELAHQWFGDLVTMKWWDDLWLNEGFASFVETIGAAHVEPEASILERFCIDNTHDTFDMDSLTTSHPISAKVTHPNQINELFDRISYGKGASIIRMMFHFLGEENFIQGLTSYLNKHKYGNAEQNDLWESLTNQAHKVRSLDNDISVKTVMDTWTLQMGYPVINVNRNYEDNSMTITQERFLSLKNQPKKSGETEDTHDYKWWVPISFDFEGGKFNQTRNSHWLKPDQDKLTIQLPEDTKKKALIVNVQQTGYYRVNYDAKNWAMVTKALKTNSKSIHRSNKGQIFNDIFSLAKVGRIPYQTAFESTKYFANEDDGIPWKALFYSLGHIKKMLWRSPGYGFFKKYMQSEMMRPYMKLTFHKMKHESIDRQLLREDIVNWMCELGYDDCQKECADSFHLWMNTNNPDANNKIEPSLRKRVYCEAIKKGDEKEWMFLWNRLKYTSNANEKRNIMYGLSCTSQVWILQKYLDMTIDPKSDIRKQDGSSVVSYIAGNPIGRYMTWDWLRNKWSKISGYFDTAISSSVGRMIKSATRDFNTPFELKELEDFYEQHKNELGTAKRGTLNSIEKVRANVQWMENYYTDIVSWLQNNV